MNISDFGRKIWRKFGRKIWRKFWFTLFGIFQAIFDLFVEKSENLIFLRKVSKICLTIY